MSSIVQLSSIVDEPFNEKNKVMTSIFIPLLSAPSHQYVGNP